MRIKEAWYYTIKLITNSWLHKTLSTSLLMFLWIIWPNETVIFAILFWLWLFSMIFWTINWTLQNWFNIRKFLMWWVKIITYWVLIYFAKSLSVVTHVEIWVEVFTTFMIFELLLSIIKHCSELGIPMPSNIIKFITKQEQDFEDKYLWWKKKL